MAKTVRSSDHIGNKDLPLMKEWKTSRYFRKTVVQLRTEFRNDTESTIQVQTSNSSSNGSQNGLGSIPGKVDDLIRGCMRRSSQYNIWSIFGWI